MDKYLTFIKSHERLILVLVALLLLWLGARKWIEHRDAADHDKAVIAKEKVELDAKAAKDADGKVVILQQQVGQLQQQNAQLQREVLNAINTRNTETGQRKHAEETAPLTDISNRWAGLLALPGGSLSVVGGGISANDFASRRTVQSLEDGATAQANFQDLQKIDSGKDGQIKGLNDLVASMDQSAKAQQVLLADQVTSCKADAKAAADVAGKKRRSAFLHGLEIGAGVIGAVALKFL